MDTHRTVLELPGMRPAGFNRDTAHRRYPSTWHSLISSPLMTVALCLMDSWRS